MGVIVIAILSLFVAGFAVVLGFAAIPFAANMQVLVDNPLVQLLTVIMRAFGFQWLDKTVGDAHQMVGEATSAMFESFAIAPLLVVTSYGLLMLRKWGRILAIVVSVSALAHAVVMILTPSGSLPWHIFAIAINLWIILYLFKARVKHVFA